MLLLLVVIALALAACSKDDNPLEPANSTEKVEAAPPATTPEQLIHNLAQAIRNRDKVLYGTLLDEDFRFVEFGQYETRFENDRETELDIIEGLFDVFRHHAAFDFTLKHRDQELGSEYPAAFPGDPNGHPDEDWEVLRGRVQMALLRSVDEGYRIDQDMTYKLRRNPKDERWKIVRWENGALTGSCRRLGKIRLEVSADAWGCVKRLFKTSGP